jgi:ATP-dependent exoDNAse (exonuclease V) beta subunit
MMSNRIVLAPRIIRASAGTGKTRDLSSRYIGLLALGESPDRILATTFTKKAAGEIRERVFSRLAQAAQSVEKAQELGLSFGNTHFSAANALELLVRITKDQHRLMITTLDGLFISIARSFALELGLSADWRIASTHESELLREEAVRGLFERNQRAVALELVRAIHGGLFARSVHTQIVRDVTALYQLYLFSPASAWNWIQPALTPAESEYASNLDLIESIQAPLTKSQAPDKRWSAQLKSLHRLVERRDWLELLNNGLVKAVIDQSYSYYKLELEDKLCQAIVWVLSEARRETSIRLKLQLGALHTMLDHYDQSYRVTQRRLSVLGFDDVKQHLARSALFGKLEHIYYRLDSRISHLLLDEFQDTSMTEWRVLQPIASEILAKGDAGSFFCVGDVKQAIYGWRGGEAEIFATMDTYWPELEAETKQTTYRCAPAVIEFVNQVFFSLPQVTCLDKYRESVSTWGERFEQHHAARVELEGCVELQIVAKDGEAVASRVACLVQELTVRYPQASIGILVRSNKAVAEIIDAFSQLTEQLEVSEEGGNPLTDSAAVRIILSLLKYLEHPGDTLARFHLEHGEIAKVLGVPAAEAIESLRAWQLTLRSQLITKGYGSSIAAWVELINSRFSSRDRIRLDQLVDLGYRFDTQRGLVSDYFIEFVMHEKVDLPSEASIRVMTVHQSKGLEFDIVILPQLEAAFRSPQGVLVERESALSDACRIAPAHKSADRILMPELQAMYDEAYGKSVSEALSLLYVAVTRARQGMYLVVPEELRKGYASFAKIIQEAYFGLAQPEGRILTGSVDWKLQSTEAHKAPTAEYVACSKDVFKAKRISRRHLPQGLSPSVIAQHHYEPNTLSQGLAHYARVRGVVLHALLESISWIDDFNVDLDQSFSLCRKQGLSSLMAEKLVTEFQQLVTQSGLKSALSRKRYSDKADVMLYRERRFAHLHEGKLLSGAFDRLVVESENGRDVRAEVIDFKSERLPVGVSALEVAERYRMQLSQYCLVAERLTGPDCKIKGFILFIENGEMVEVLS